MIGFVWQIKQQQQQEEEEEEPLVFIE